MESTNFLREAIVSLKQVKFTAADWARYDSAVKFALPFDGVVLNNDLAALPEIINLPFPEIIIEYSSDEEYLTDTLSYMIHAGFEPDRITGVARAAKLRPTRNKVVVIASQPETGMPIQLTVVQFELPGRVWDMGNDLIQIPAEREAALRLYHSDPFNPPPGDDFIVERERPIGQDDRSKIAAWLTIKRPAMAVYALCEALNTTNVTQTTLPAKKRSFTEQRKKALPYSSYQTLVIDVSKPITVRAPTRSGVSHASPREHVRRGHWRTYRSGKRVWVEAMMVNPGTGGSIHKDYRLK